MPTFADLVPSEVFEKMGMNPLFNNHFWCHADDTLNKLKNRTEEDFCSDDVSYAIKTLERYYKAIIELAHESDCDYTMPYDQKHGKYIVDYSHGLKALRQEIEANFPTCFESLPRSEKFETSHNLGKYQALYVDASYYTFANYQTFQEILSFIQKERTQMEEFLNSRPFDKDKDDDYGDDV